MDKRDKREWRADSANMVLCDHSLIVTRWNTQEKYRIAELLMCQRCARIFEWQYVVDRDSEGKNRSLASSLASSDR